MPRSTTYTVAVNITRDLDEDIKAVRAKPEYGLMTLSRALDLYLQEELKSAHIGGTGGAFAIRHVTLPDAKMAGTLVMELEEEGQKQFHDVPLYRGSSLASIGPFWQSVPGDDGTVVITYENGIWTCYYVTGSDRRQIMTGTALEGIVRRIDCHLDHSKHWVLLGTVWALVEHSDTVTQDLPRSAPC